MAKANLVEKISQTSRAILFEKFNDNPKQSLVTLLTNALQGNDKLQENEAVNIVKELECKSFNDFLEKFKPTIYQSMNTSGENGVQFKYGTDYVEDSVEIDICEQDFYKLVRDIISDKCNSQKSNIEYNYGKIEDLLAPKKALDRAKETRALLEMSFENYLEAKQAHRTEDAKKYAGQVKGNLKKVQQQYEKNPIALLPLTIGDTDVIIKEGIKCLSLAPPSQDCEVLNSQPVKALPCSLEWDENGNIVPVEIEKKEETVILETDNDKQLPTLLGQVEKLADKIPSLQKSESMKGFFLSTFAGSGTTGLIIPEDANVLNEVMQKQQRNINIYKEAQQSFVDAISKIIQKLVDIEMFFRHATMNGQLETSVIVSNCDVDKVVNNESKINEFLKLLNSAEKTKVWFAVLPPIENEEYQREISENNSDDDDDNESYDDFGDIFDDNNWNKSNVNNEGSVRKLVEILAKHDIVSFVNCIANEKTGFKAFSENSYDEFKKIAKGLGSTSNCIFCYPNFTVIPKEETDISINEEHAFDGTKIEKKYIKIPAVYIDSAYIAAAQVIASQSHKILISKKYAIEPKSTNVRFDLEKHYFDFQTCFNRETLYNRTPEFNKMIENDENAFGFCYCDNDRFFEDKKLTCTYIQIARTNDGKPIYNTLVKNFVKQYIALNDFRKSESITVWNNSMKELYHDNKFENMLFDYEDSTKQGLSLEPIEGKKGANKVVINLGDNSGDMSIEGVDVFDEG